MTCHEYQQEHCKHLTGPIVNIACKEDPACLGDLFNCTNLDLLNYDPHTHRDLTKLKNFVQGSALDLPFNDGEYGGAVLGEFIEHCQRPQALKALQEATRILKPDGQLVLTYPMDGRPKKGQHPDHLLIEWDTGITSWHQTVWEEEALGSLLGEAGLEIIHRTKLHYGGICEYGWGICLKRKETNAAGNDVHNSQLPGRIEDGTNQVHEGGE